MIIEIDFNSDDAIYIQLCNQIILGIATSKLREGEQLPSVRTLADTIGINMHTVNKAYSILQREGFVKIDRRKGVVIAVDINKLEALEEAREELAVVLARALCKNVTRDEIHGLVDQIYDSFEGN
ncbi:GntR family transcriptional regulator [Butyrivibrio sp. NC3005]|uniref:GntR family transcriptional regulator n=1 Tax=Butyrivibrio sp. NC3005 TaxID=1280685 RepID=UPI00040F7A03|nr:GntR family transcriptional regulator [Butyrivibrio sp. NC3005]